MSLERGQKQPKNKKLLHNVFSNYFSRIWSTVVVLIFTPLYIQVLGLEKYGIIAVFTVLQAAILLLDMGITPTITREAARLEGGTRSSQSIHNLFRSIEYLIIIIAVTMVVVVITASSFLAENWLQPKSLTTDMISAAFKIMSLALAFRWLEQVYKAALQGLQDQIWLGGAVAISETIRWGGSYVVLICFSETVNAFFLWQIISSFITITILRHRLFKILPKQDTRPVFVWNEIIEIKKYAIGMFFSSILVFMLTQIDKILVARLLPLSEFSIYMLCATLSNGLLQLINPITIAIFPKMAQYVAQDDCIALQRLFIESSQWMTLVILPTALTMAFFSKDILSLWTGDWIIAQNGMLILALLTTATLLNGLMNVPYMVQLAYGWTSLSIALNAACLVLTLPAMFLLIPRFGGLGAAAVLVALNLSYIIIGGPLMFRKIIRDCRLDWALYSLAIPIVAGLASASLMKLIAPPTSTPLTTIGFVSIAGFFILTAVAGSLPIPRRYFLYQMAKFKV